MKRIIKLTESDLTRIVRRVIKEQKAMSGKDIQFILVKNILKTIKPDFTLKRDDYNYYENIDFLFEMIIENYDIETCKRMYMSWLEKNGFEREDIYVANDNMSRLQELITKKGLK